jgi:hypothetical protein
MTPASSSARRSALTVVDLIAAPLSNSAPWSATLRPRVQGRSRSIQEPCVQPKTGPQCDEMGAADEHIETIVVKAHPQLVADQA